MEGLFYCLEKTDYLSIHLIRFYYDTNYVIYKKITGTRTDYFKKEIAHFKIEGISVKADPAHTFIGAFNESMNSISFKVENEINDTSESDLQHDILSFSGKIIDHHKLILNQLSKRTKYSVEREYLKTSDEEVLNLIAQLV